MPITAPATGDSSFFTLENLEGAAFLAFEAQRSQCRLMPDVVYVSFADDIRSGPLLTISEKIKGHVFEAAVGHQPAQRPEWELLAGARFFQIENDLDLAPGPRAKSEKTWTDPFIYWCALHSLAVGELAVPRPSGPGWFRRVSRSDAELRL